MVNKCPSRDYCDILRLCQMDLVALLATLRHGKIVSKKQHERGLLHPEMTVASR